MTSVSRAAVQTPFKIAGGLPQRGQPFASDYRLDSSRVDVKLARALYKNVEPRYKLGAGFARPAINVPTGFMGVPQLRVPKGGSDDANQLLHRLRDQWSGQIINIHQATQIDGDVLVRLRQGNRSPVYQGLFGPEDNDLELVYEPSESFEILHMEEDMDAVDAFRIRHNFYIEENGVTVERHMYETVTADYIELLYENNFRPKRKLPNPLGFVPAVYFQNESFRHQVRGRSELEPLEPYMRFYHDVMMHAGSASKLHSTAKLILRVQDVERFLNNNFSDAEINEGRLRFKDKDVLFFETGAPEMGVTGSTAYQEGADVVQAKAPLGDTNTLLEYIFLNIVDASEVPEWAFGGAIASSKASVTEQSAPLVHKVNRKRHLFEGYWGLVGRMALKMNDITSRVEVSWEDISQRDTKAEAEGIKSLSEALIALNDAEIMSKISVADELRPYLRKILPYDANDTSKEEKVRLQDELSQIEQSVRQFMNEGDALEQDRQEGLRAIG